MNCGCVLSLGFDSREPRMLKTLAVALLSSSAFFAISVNAENEFSEKELASLPLSVQKFVTYNRHLIDDLGYAGVKAISFDESKNGTALTAIIKNKNEKKYPVYSAVILDNLEGPTLLFKNYIKCVPTSLKKLVPRSIYIDGQKISAQYMCIKGEGGEENNIGAYQIKNAEGRAFAHNAFSNNMFVFVKFEDVEVPFSSSGFSHIWEEASRPAL